MGSPAVRPKLNCSLKLTLLPSAGVPEGLWFPASLPQLSRPVARIDRLFPFEETVNAADGARVCGNPDQCYLWLLSNNKEGKPEEKLHCIARCRIEPSFGSRLDVV